MTRAPSISTHVLDQERGMPAQGVPVTLARREGEGYRVIGRGETNEDGRIADLVGGPLQAGSYRLTFDAAAYFRARGQEAEFFTGVQLEFQIADTQRHYHVPLLLTRFAYTSYRGS